MICKQITKPLHGLFVDPIARLPFRAWTTVAGIPLRGPISLSPLDDYPSRYPRRDSRDIAAQLERMREQSPRGGRQWAASSVKSLLDQARRLGLVVPPPREGL